MRKRRLPPTILACLTLALAACACDTSGAGDDAAPPPLTVPTGVAYIGMGPIDASVNLTEIAAGREPRTVTRHRDGHGVSWITAGGNRLVVAAPYNYADQLGEYDQGRWNTRLSSDDRTFTPALSADGRLAYRHPVSGSPPKVWLVTQHSPRAPLRRVLDLANIADGPVAWGPGNQLAALSQPRSEQAAIVIIDVTTGRVLQRLRAPRAGALVWSPGRSIAYRYQTSNLGGGLLDPHTGHIRPTPPGWMPLTWSPDGGRLLVTDQRHLGLVDPTKPQHIHRLPGQASQPIWLAAWTNKAP